LGAYIDFIVLLCGEVPRLKSDSFCSDFDKEVVLNTEESNFFASLDILELF
jgi:hypothetical protein